MAYYIFKLAVSAILVVAISEIARRSSFVGALLASVPLVSVMAMIWLYVDTGDAARVGALASSILWLVIPSLALFVALPLLLERGVNFYLSMTLSVVLTIGCYGAMIVLLKRVGIDL